MDMQLDRDSEKDLCRRYNYYTVQRSSISFVYCVVPSD